MNKDNPDAIVFSEEQEELVRKLASDLNWATEMRVFSEHSAWHIAKTLWQMGWKKDK